MHWSYSLDPADKSQNDPLTQTQHQNKKGFDVSQTAKGVRVMLDLAAAVEHALQEPQPRITVLDIGGGLSANYASDEAKPSHAELCAALREVCMYR